MFTFFVYIRWPIYYISHQVSVKKKFNSFGKDIEKTILNTGMDTNLSSSFPLLSNCSFSCTFCSQVMNYFLHFMCVLNYNGTRYYDRKHYKVNLHVWITKIFSRFHYIFFLFLFLSSFPSHYRIFLYFLKETIAFTRLENFYPNIQLLLL